MSEHMQFLPKRDLLTLEELDRLCSAFVGMGCASCGVTGANPWCGAISWSSFRAMSHASQARGWMS